MKIIKNNYEKTLGPVGLKLKDILTEENKGKTFKRKSDSLKVKITDTGKTMFSHNVYINLNDEWEEVEKPEPVDFMTAFNAWYAGSRTIVCEMGEERRKFSGGQATHWFNSDWIITGKWYIED